MISSKCIKVGIWKENNSKRERDDFYLYMIMISSKCWANDKTQVLDSQHLMNS